MSAPVGGVAGRQSSTGCPTEQPRGNKYIGSDLMDITESSLALHSDGHRTKSPRSTSHSK